VRAGLGVRLDRLRKAELAFGGLAVAQRRAKPDERARRLGIVGQNTLDRPDIGGRRRPGHPRIGRVGVDDAALLVGHDKALRHGIDKRLRQFVGGRTRSDLDEADRGGEQEAGADHRQNAEQAEQELVAQPVTEKREEDRRAHENDGENDQTSDRPEASPLVDDRHSLKIANRFSGHASLTRRSPSSRKRLPQTTARHTSPPAKAARCAGTSYTPDGCELAAPAFER
jgi:hypothetical protein